MKREVTSMERSINNKIDKNMNLEQIKINAILAADPEGIQIDGDHYKGDKIPLYQFLNQNNVNTMDGYAIKYAFRHRRKNKEKDIAKAIHTLQLILKDEYNMYMLGGQLYTKEKYDELISQAKKEEGGRETETTLMYNDKGIDINSEIKKQSNKDVYVAKLIEVKAAFIDLYDIDKIKQDVSVIGLTLVSHDSVGVTLKKKDDNLMFIPKGMYVVLKPNGEYEVFGAKAFWDVYERKL